MTAYERLTMGIDRLTTKGRHQGSLRKGEGDASGPACLVGSLLRDDEVCELAPRIWASPTVLLGESTITEALRAAGFATWVEAFYWNDGIVSPAPPDGEVIARLEAGRDHILHQEADKAEVDVPETALAEAEVMV